MLIFGQHDGLRLLEHKLTYTSFGILKRQTLLRKRQFLDKHRLVGTQKGSFSEPVSKACERDGNFGRKEEERVTAAYSISNSLPLK